MWFSWGTWGCLGLGLLFAYYWYQIGKCLASKWLDGRRFHNFADKEQERMKWRERKWERGRKKERGRYRGQTELRLNWAKLQLLILNILLKYPRSVFFTFPQPRSLPSPYLATCFVRFSQHFHFLLQWFSFCRLFILPQRCHQKERKEKTSWIASHHREEICNKNSVANEKSTHTNTHTRWYT